MVESNQSTSNEMFRIRWDGSKVMVDLSDTIQKFRDGKELLDVSLVCANGSGGNESLRAHKLLLAAFSPVFKDMFNHSSQNDSCVHLKGVSKDNLSLILDFIYQGSVDVPKSKVNGFLADAHELQIQGLRSDIDPNKSITNDKAMTNSTPVSKQNKSKASKKRVKNESKESMQEKAIVAQERNPLESSNPQSDDESAKLVKRPSKKKLKSEGMNNSPVTEYLNSIPGKMNTSAQSQNDSVLSELNDSQLNNQNDSITHDKKSHIEELFEKISVKYHGKEGRKRYLVRCNICLKEMISDKKVKHLRETHPFLSGI